MSGSLLLKKEGAWKEGLPAVVITAVLTFLCVWPLVRRVPQKGMLPGLMAALVTYLLWRGLYPALAGLFQRGGKSYSLSWTLDETLLTLGEARISRESIKMVHCWPGRDALGTKHPGWTVNIETTGKNYLLRSLEGGEEQEASERSLRALVEALGYGSAWVEG